MLFTSGFTAATIKNYWRRPRGFGEVSRDEWSDAARRGDNWVDQRRTKGTFGEKLRRRDGDKGGKLNKSGKTWAANMPWRHAGPRGAVKTQLMAPRRKRTPEHSSRCEGSVCDVKGVG